MRWVKERQSWDIELAARTDKGLTQTKQKRYDDWLAQPARQLHVDQARKCEVGAGKRGAVAIRLKLSMLAEELATHSGDSFRTLLVRQYMPAEVDVPDVNFLSEHGMFLGRGVPEPERDTVDAILLVLLYGLDSLTALTLTTKDLNRIDGFWFRFLRRIVGVKASFYSRISSEEVYRKANLADKTLDHTSLYPV